MVDHRLTPRAVARTLDRLAVSAGVAPFTAHDFRRTVAGDLLEAGADISTVQRTLGHADPSTTARYDRRPAAARRKAARLRHVPYRRRREGARAICVLQGHRIAWPVIDKADTCPPPRHWGPEPLAGCSAASLSPCEESRGPAMHFNPPARKRRRAWYN